eukprot:39102-Pleurochrysis_carterae.AAC.2
MVGDGRSAQKGRKLLGRSTQGALREGNVRRRVRSGHADDVRIVRGRHVAAVGWMLHDIVPSGRARRAEELARAPNEFIRAVELWAVAVGYIVCPGRLVSSAEHRGTTVGDQQSGPIMA